MLRSGLVLTLCSIVLAGCATAPDDGAPEEVVDTPPCGDFETIHYEQAPEQAALQATFEGAMYDWDARTDRIAEVTSPGGRTIVLSHEPGASGEDLILTATGPDAHDVAVQGSLLVNLTSPDVRIKSWIVDNNC